MSGSHQQQQPLFDPESIPLPDDIPVPDEIPLPPDNGTDETVNHSPSEASELVPTNKRLAPDDEIDEDDDIIQLTHKHANKTLNNQQQLQQPPHTKHNTIDNHSNKKVKRDDRRRDELGTRQPQTNHESEDNLEREEELMSRLMGFSNFDTTKGKMVPGNQNIGAIHVVKKRRYRQYMNRKGGFNRPLDKVP